MKKFLFLLLTLFALTARATATNITVGAVQALPGFNTANAGVDLALSGVTVTLGSPNVTCTNCLPPAAVGLSGMQIALGTPAVVYTIASVTNRSTFSLTANYAAANGTVTGTLFRFVVLRIYATSTFIPAGSTVVVVAGAPGTTAWYRRYGVSIVNDGTQNFAQFPQIVLPATTDSSNSGARYYAALYTQGGGLIQSYPGCIDEWRLDATTTPTSWAQICNFNGPLNPTPTTPINFYTTGQIDARFPSCTVNQLIYYAATGNVQNCLTLSGDFTVSGGIVSILNPVRQIQNQGSNLPIRNFLNFTGSSVTAVDNAGASRTDVTFATPLNNLASNVTNGFWGISGGGATATARVLTGTANQITVTNGDGTAGNPTFSLPSALTFTGFTITGGTYTSSTLTSPQIGTAILDTNGNTYFTLTPTASAVNGFTVTNAAANNSPSISPTGTSTNIDFTVTPKGSGKLGVGTPGASPVAGIVGGPDASGTNTAGVDLQVAPGKATGNAVPGNVSVRYPLITATGTTLQSLSANAYPVVTNLYTNTTAGTAIANTTTETSLFTGVSGSAGSTNTIEAGISRAGTNYKVRIVGNVANTGTPTLQVKGKLGTTVIVDTTAATTSTVSGKFWLDLDIQVVGIGASGSVISWLRFDYSSANSGAVTMATINGASGGTTIDLTSAQTLDVTITWGTASASNTLQVFELTITRAR